jgi:hypothetical protein
MLFCLSELFDLRPSYVLGRHSRALYPENAYDSRFRRDGIRRLRLWQIPNGSGRALPARLDGHRDHKGEQQLPDECRARPRRGAHLARWPALCARSRL